MPQKLMEAVDKSKKITIKILPKSTKEPPLGPTFQKSAQSANFIYSNFASEEVPKSEKKILLLLLFLLPKK